MRQRRKHPIIRREFRKQSRRSRKLRKAAAQAKREAEDTKECVEKAIRESKRAEEVVVKVTKEEEKAAEESAKREAEEAKARASREAKEAKKAMKSGDKALATALYTGMVKLAIASPVDNERLRKFERSLAQVEELRRFSVVGSAYEGTKFIVFAEKPIPLLSVLGDMPSVERGVKKDGRVEITLRAKQPSIGSG